MFSLEEGRRYNTPSTSQLVQLRIFTVNELDEISERTENVDKRSLTELLGLPQRDIRNLFIDTSMIEPRDTCIIVCLSCINAVITPSTMYVVTHTPDGCFTKASRFCDQFKTKYAIVRDMQEWEPWQQLAIETIILDLTQTLQYDYETIVNEASTQFKSVVKQASLAARVGVILAEAQRGEQALESAMEEVEEDDRLDDELLEPYLFQLKTMIAESSELDLLLRQKRRLAGIELDKRRNALMQIDLQVAFITLGIAVASLIYGLFGMNLTNPWNFPADGTYPWEEMEKQSLPFTAVCGIGVLLTVVIWGVLAFRTRKLIMK
eukprot:gnl/Dysnectes_brevis/6263_a9602_427.p1 GENE.gnl/Dysnectes_brevis/6263_a9602_427~~gnl/Dysnectes_brevis/6263_a9602_427.p1  ORF type:complete len:321 (+),score=66.33 gnl/Dysnectes_brevis/6263_a9602_427:30-992(+)